MKYPVTPFEAASPRGDQAAWRARQDALDTNYIEDNLTPAEIQFYESFIAAGNRVQLIPKDKVYFQPTNDFIWLNLDEIVCELKASKERYATVRNAISVAVSNAQKQNVVKDNFIIDFGNRSVSEKLKRQLALYNYRNPRLPISRLWIWSSGNLEEIALEN